MGSRSSKEPKRVKNDLELAAFRATPTNVGLSLDQLGAALAGMLGSGDDPYAPAAGETAAGSVALEGLATVEPVSAAQTDDACEVTPRSILEAMLFVGSPQNEPLTSKQVASLMRGVRAAEIDALVRELNQAYQSRNCPYTIVAEGAGYRLGLREEYARVRDKFYGRARQARLSQAAIEVLAAVAYHGPITGDEVSRMRGTGCGHILAQLVRRQLLRLERTEGEPRRARYVTTERFLALFGLANLEDLPRSHDLEEA
jgi:segregation and condensation protein B